MNSWITTITVMLLQNERKNNNDGSRTLPVPLCKSTKLFLFFSYKLCNAVFYFKQKRTKRFKHFKLLLEIIWQICIWTCCIMDQSKQKNQSNQYTKKPVKSIHKEINQLKNKIKCICKVNHQNPLSLREHNKHNDLNLVVLNKIIEIWLINWGTSLSE